jgi:hypothetical protein
MYLKEGRRGFKKKQQDNGPLFFEKLGSLVCLAYKEEKEDVKVEQHQLMKLLKALPSEFLSFSLAVQSLLENPEDDTELKKFAFEADRIERVTYVKCKSPNIKTYELMFQLYIEGKFNQERQPSEELNKAKKDVSQSVDIDLSMSRPIDESSMMLNDTLNNSLIKP